MLTISNKKPIKINRLDGSWLLGRTTVKMWGLWSSIPSLDPGNYQLEIHGEHSSGCFWVQANYDLLIK